MTDTPPPFLDKLEALDLLRDMVRIRRLEEKSAELYSAGKIRGFLHLYIGEEAVAAGAMRAFFPQDNVLTTYREHGHALVRGISARAILAEMYGKAGRCSGGRGGSMHLFDKSRRFYGGSAIVAGHLPMAVGMALADKMQGHKRVTACFFGDGATAEGAFHESLNLAALWRLPVLFLCENNRYAMGTELSRYQAQTDLAAHARSYNVAAETVDGMDVLAVWEATHDAAERARLDPSPAFLEFQTYRFRAHSMFDPELYRDKAEVEEWKKRDPIHLWEERLRALGWLPAEESARLEAEVQAELTEAVRFAESDRWESQETLLRHVYAREPLP